MNPAPPVTTIEESDMKSRAGRSEHNAHAGAHVQIEAVAREVAVQVPRAGDAPERLAPTALEAPFHGEGLDDVAAHDHVRVGHRRGPRSSTPLERPSTRRLVDVDREVRGRAAVSRRCAEQLAVDG